MAAKEITKDDMETLRKVLKGDDEMSIVKTMQRLNLDFEDKVQSFSRLFEFCLHLHDSDNITFVAWNLCCEMCCCGPKTSKPVRATFIVTLMFHLHPNFELINHLYLLLPMRTTDKFNDVIQKKKNKREIFCRHAIHGDDNACASHGYFMVWVLLVRGSLWVQLLILMNIVFHFFL